jgi:hypothetical protein
MVLRKRVNFYVKRFHMPPKNKWESLKNKNLKEKVEKKTLRNNKENNDLFLLIIK